MKNLVKLALLIILINSCCKDDNCNTNITQNLKQWTHYNRYFCGNKEFTKVYDSTDDFVSNQSCRRSQIPIPLNSDLEFKGKIMAQGIFVPYLGLNGGDPGYELATNVIKNDCDKTIEFTFILKTIDTTRVLEHLETVLVVVEDVDSDYTVLFNHVVIPFSE